VLRVTEQPSPKENKMKKRMLVSMALGLGLVALAASSANAGSAPGTGIRGSKHDMSATTGIGTALSTTLGSVASDPLQRVCIYCHAPHNTIRAGATTAVYMPLWNHAMTTMSSYLMYDSGQAPLAGPHATQSTDASVGAMVQPVNVSKLCLSCHDGTVALNTFGSSKMVHFASYRQDSDPGATYLTGQYLIGEDTNGDNIGELDNHHPIGFDYDAVQALDNEVAASSVVFAGTGVAISDVLYAGAMECATCHDVHNSTTGMGEKFLWTSNASSNFCCTCHLKCD
jgi:hypothetical protein